MHGLGGVEVEALKHVVFAHLLDLLGIHADAREVRQRLERGSVPATKKGIVTKK